MSLLGSTGFAVLLWGSALGVLCVFAYELCALAGDARRVDG